MDIRSTYRLMTALLLGLFLILQINAATHIVEAGDTHEHDCVYCLVVSEEDGAFEAVLDAVDVTFDNEVAPIAIYSVRPVDIWRPIPYGRAPPPRAPPQHV